MATDPLREVLSRMVSEQGEEVALNASLFRGSINDVLGVDARTYHREVAILASAVEVGAAAALASDPVVAPAKLDMLAAQLAEQRSIQPEAAHWAVATWAAALGSSPQAAAGFAATPPVFDPMQPAGSDPGVTVGPGGGPPPPPPGQGSPPGGGYAPTPPPPPPGGGYAPTGPPPGGGYAPPPPGGGYGPTPTPPPWGGGPTPSGPPGTPPGRKKPPVLLFVGIAVLLIGAGVGIFLLTKGGDSNTGSHFSAGPAPSTSEDTTPTTEAPSTTNTVDTGTGSGTATGLTSAQQALLAHVPAEFRSTCRTPNSPAFNGRYPGLSCDPNNDIRVYYYQFPDVVSMNSQFTSLVSDKNLVRGTCNPAQNSAFRSTERYTINGTDAGSEGCYVDSDGDPWIDWTHDGLRIYSYGFAVGSTDKEALKRELYDFWAHKSGPV